MTQLAIEGRKLPDRQVCLRYGVCNRTLSRWDRESGTQFSEADNYQPQKIPGRSGTGSLGSSTGYKVTAGAWINNLTGEESEPAADTKRCNQDPSRSTAGSITVTDYAAMSDAISTNRRKAVKAA